MISFYCIDGPRKTHPILSDFRTSILPSGETYYKFTFAIKTDLGVLYADIASIDPDRKTIEITEDIPFHIRTQDNKTIPALPLNGVVV